MDIKIVSKNRKAAHDYFLLDRYEAGIVLQGSEIKSIRNGQMSLKEAYVQIENNEAWLVDAHISPYDHSGRFNHDPVRPRRLLLHKKEIRELWDSVRQRGMTIIPTRVYLKDGRAKVEIALARGKKTYDKREAIAKRDRERDSAREMRIR